MSVRRTRWLAIAAVGIVALVAGCSAKAQEPTGAGGDDPAAQTSPVEGGGNPANNPKPEETSPAPTTTTQPPPAPPAKLAVTLAGGATNASVVEPVTVKATDGTLTSVVLTNPEGERVEGTLSADKKTWRSAEELGYSKQYRVVSKAKNADGKPTQRTTSFTTVTPTNMTAIYSSLPSASVTDVGIGQNVVLNFDEPITDKAAVEQAVTIKTTPAQVGAWRWLSDQQAQWRPRDYWQPGTKVTVDALIYGKDLGGGLYGQQDLHFSFTVHDSWKAIGDAAKHTLDIYHNGEFVRSLPASFGSDTYPTETGMHVVAEEYDLYYMNSSTWGLPADAPGGYEDFPAYWAVRISNNGEFVHVNDGTIWAQGNTNVSHGCINLSMDNGRWFHDTFGYGDLVEIRNGGTELSYDDGYGQWNASWAEWTAPSPSE